MLVFKYEPLEKPACEDATDFLLFLGQIRYALIAALKVKSLQERGVEAQAMKAYFPKLSPQGLSMQIKKTEGVRVDYLQTVLGLVYDKELELKQDFLQPSGLFKELIAKITEQKLCQKQAR
jgi:DNA polymerase III delta subunit